MDRQEIIGRFEALLDAALAGEAPPAGIDAEILEAVRRGDAAPAEERADSYALWSAMTALTQEIKLQGRAFQELNLALPAQAQKMSDELRALYTEREKGLRKEEERRVRREILTALIDLRDRLERGLETVRTAEPSIAKEPEPKWHEKLFGKVERNTAAAVETVRALARGYELAAERVDQTLSDFNAREIQCLGDPFDPKRMNAIETEESDSAEAGTVLEVFRSGYEWNGEVFRTAQVKVAKRRGETNQ